MNPLIFQRDVSKIKKNWEYLRNAIFNTIFSKESWCQNHRLGSIFDLFLIIYLSPPILSYHETTLTLLDNFNFLIGNWCSRVGAIIKLVTLVLQKALTITINIVEFFFAEQRPHVRKCHHCSKLYTMKKYHVIHVLFRSLTSGDPNLTNWGLKFLPQFCP